MEYSEDDPRSLLPAVMPMVRDGGPKSGEFISNVQVSVAPNGTLLVEAYDNEAYASPVKSELVLFAGLDTEMTELVKIDAPLEWESR
jgi:hypothetical protein